MILLPMMKTILSIFSSSPKQQKNPANRPRATHPKARGKRWQEKPAAKQIFLISVQQLNSPFGREGNVLTVSFYNLKILSPGVLAKCNITVISIVMLR